MLLYSFERVEVQSGIEGIKEVSSQSLQKIVHDSYLDGLLYNFSFHI